jgi:hypothetical protein
VTYAYEIRPMSFLNLPRQERLNVIGSFSEFLNSLDGAVRFTVRQTVKSIRISGSEVQTPFLRYFVESENEIDIHLAQLVGDDGFEAAALAPCPKVLRQTAKYLQLEGSLIAKCFFLLDLPDRMAPVFVYDIQSLADYIAVEFTPMDPGKATARIETYDSFLDNLIDEYVQSGKRIRGRLQKEKERAQVAREAVQQGENIFDVKCLLMIAGTSIQELQEKVRILDIYARRKGYVFDSPQGYQLDMLRMAPKAMIKATTGTAACFFPFSSDDLIEEPDGVPIGVNDITDNPIVFDVSRRPNYNILNTGETGSGKSMFEKITLSRTIERHPDVYAHVIDTQSEFIKTPLARSWWEDKGFTIFEYKPAVQLGLDPQVILKDRAGEFYTTLMGITDPQGIGDIQTEAGKAKTFREFYERLFKADERLAKPFRNLYEGAEAPIFQGEPLRFTDKMVFCLDELRSNYLKRLVAVLLFQKIWDHYGRLPDYRTKYLILEEAWRYLDVLGAATVMEEVARQGRKLHTVFHFVTQSIGDMMKNEHAKSVVEQCTTAFVFQQKPRSVPTLMETFNLEQDEAESCTSFRDRGFCRLVTSKTHVPLRVEPTPLEYWAFTTDPKDLQRLEESGVRNVQELTRAESLLGNQ